MLPGDYMRRWVIVLACALPASSGAWIMKPIGRSQGKGIFAHDDPIAR